MCDQRTVHGSDASTGLDSGSAARPVDVERILLELFKDADVACSIADISFIERIVSDIKYVAYGIQTTGSLLIQYYNERSDYVQFDALRLMYNPLIGEHSNQARQHLTDRLYFLTEVPKGRTLVCLRYLENKLMSFFSEAERALCSSDDALLKSLIDNVNSVADKIASLARPRRQVYDHEGKSKEPDTPKRRFEPLIIDRVNLVIKLLGKRRSHLANFGDLDVKLFKIRQDLYVMFDDTNTACQHNDADQIKKNISDLETLTDQV